jgi:hypothetical protein
MILLEGCESPGETGFEPMVTRKGQEKGKRDFGWLLDHWRREAKKLKREWLVGGPGEVRTPDPMVAKLVNHGYLVDFAARLATLSH